MRYALISDVHANFEALQSVLADIKKEGIKEIIFLGDAVGYGPDPEECLHILSLQCKILITGNHDSAVIGLTDIGLFNFYARRAIEWSIERISDDKIGILKKFKISEKVYEKDIFLVHSTPKEPEKWSYLHSFEDAQINFDFFDAKICFLGHTHSPFIIERKSSGELALHSNEIWLSDTSRYIVNVGSVGQPRDRDSRSCYCIFDDGFIYFRRIEYDIKKTQYKMVRYGLPQYLINRLTYGV